ncbi:NUDIX hydrolase [Nocardioides mangrovi]|uniref:NUDIX hydrolase n=1 Tax=Nocardioides mangrovi TaxID=2874580 RepID=A0ABS7U6P6_9ACTN|nr:NUDIX hydrolase [Nocardioides mangrovi]MBZ5736653.1 NUDIX hydrolase [Nocardioides mangrovi]
MTEPTTSVSTVAEGIARISWTTDEPIDVIRHQVVAALVDHARVEALVDPDDEGAQRAATWSGLRREGVMRGVTVDGAPVDRIVYARLATDTPLNEPEGFRALLNSFLPRKRAIGQMLVRDGDGRVLLCNLTYKPDWDLPGGVVEVNESPREAVSREIEEELALQIPAGQLVLTDWLPPWSGWDDAVCLVFDGGVHDASLTDTIVREAREIRTAEFCTVDQVRERCADFTARRIEAALANVAGGGPAYTESGR